MPGFSAAGQWPTEGVPMRCKELDEAIAALRRLLLSGNERLVHDPRLRKALRELEMLKKGGRLDRRRIGQAISMVCAVLAEHGTTAPKKPVLTTKLVR